MTSTTRPAGAGDEGQADEHAARPLLDADDVGFYFAQVMQWIALHPEITNTAFRVYAVMRALYIKRRDMRTLSKDQLRYLVPGVNGKPMGRTALADALKVLERFGLVTNPDGKAQTWRIRDAETQRFVQQTKHAWLLASLPAAGDDFDGWRNVFDKLDAYRPDWETNPPVPPHTVMADVLAGQSQNRNSGNGADGAAEPAAGDQSGDESAGEGRCRNSGKPRRNSGNRCRNSGKPKAVTSGNATPNNKSQQPQDQEGGACPPEPPNPAANAAGTEIPGQPAKVVATQRKSGSNPPHARAVELAGPAAIEALTLNPEITRDELAQVIGQDNRGLTHGQAVGRAATLLAWELKLRQVVDMPAPRPESALSGP